MSLNIALAAIALCLAPTLVAAEGCAWTKEQTAMTCAEGHVLDDASGTCVPVVNS